MADLARKRLTSERKEFASDAPYGFYAKPAKTADGGKDLFLWECGVLPKAISPWKLSDESAYRVLLRFSPDFPSKPPIAYFHPIIYHPNVFTNGQVCLSILAEDKDWVPSITVKQILLGLQELLDQPNLASPANGQCAQMYNSRGGVAKYHDEVRKRAAQYNKQLEDTRKIEAKSTIAAVLKI